MAQRKDTSPDHRWLIATTHEAKYPDAAYAAQTGKFYTEPGGEAEALEVYCGQCKRPFDDVAGTECEAADGWEHLIGGPIGRRKRVHDHDCAVFGCNPQLDQVQQEALRRLAANPAPYRPDAGAQPTRWRRAL